MRLRVHHIGLHIDHRDGERVLVLQWTGPDGDGEREFSDLDPDDERRMAAVLLRDADGRTLSTNGEAA